MPATTPRSRPFARLATFYTTTFAALGVYTQYFPLWLHDVGGLAKREVTLIQSAQILARTVAGPLWAQHVDRGGRPRRTLVLLSALSIAAFLVFLAPGGLPVLLLGSVLFGCTFPPQMAILDQLALDTAHERGFRYPRVRLWGSLSFLVVIVAAGAVLETAPSGLVFAFVLGGLALSLPAAALLPEPAAAPGTDGRAPLRGLLGDRRFALFLLTCALVQGSHGTYYTLSTLHWRAVGGIGEGTAGLLWAEGVLAEILLFRCAPSAVERLRPTTLLLAGAGAACLRWLVLGATVAPGWIAAANWLHALSFGGTYLGMLQFVRRRVAPGSRTSALGLAGAASSGVGLALGTLLGGAVYERAAGAAFLAMAGMAALGGAGAVLLRRRPGTAAPRSP